MMLWIAVCAIIPAGALILWGCQDTSGPRVGRQTHSEHDGHDHGDEHAHDASVPGDRTGVHQDGEHHAEHPGHEKDGEHAEHAEHPAHEGHGSHEETVTLSAEGKRLVKLELARVEKRHIGRTIELPGEVGFNEDRLAHVTPRYGGVVRKVNKYLGNYVREGEVLATIENNQTLNHYNVRAPIRGRIVQKHLTRGEYASAETSIYVVANLATVWINLDVFPRHLDKISVGGTVIVRAVGVAGEDTGKVSYIAPLFDKHKRSATARVVLRNRDNRWRPGTFVHGEIAIRSESDVPAVTNEAVQMVSGEQCVFVPAGEGFRAQRVRTGMKGRAYTEVVEGIGAGREYVAHGAFELKAAIATSSLGDHAGHGH
jgi:cobalt-zinc-cadmium efflux system membrane fusion protein